MKIRIRGTGEKSANSWYAQHIGDEFTVLSERQGRPGHYIVDARHLNLSEVFAFVSKTDAEVVPDEHG